MNIFCLHTFLLILSNCRIDLIIFERINKKVCRQKMSIMFN